MEQLPHGMGEGRNDADNKILHLRKEDIVNGVITDNPVIKYNFNIMELEGVPHLLLDENDVSFIITDYEEVKEQKSDLYVPKTQIIM